MMMVSKSMKVLNIIAGVLLMALGVYCLCNQDIAAMTAVSRFVSAFVLRACGVRGWGWILLVGVILIAAGFVCMMDPWVSVAAIGVTVGLVFLLEGVSAVVYACIPRDK